MLEHLRVRLNRGGDAAMGDSLKQTDADDEKRFTLHEVCVCVSLMWGAKPSANAKSKLQASKKPSLGLPAAL
jgi:hypothetical protein